MRADRVATWGASKPLPRSPGLFQDHRHRAGQSAGRFLDVPDMPLLCVSFEISSSTMPLTPELGATSHA